MITDFKERVKKVAPRFLFFDKLETLQINLGNLCNQSCLHCHIGASPAGDHIMSRKVMEKIIDFLTDNPGYTVDITGGCPELNPDFKYFIEAVHPNTPRLMIRTNLTVLLEKGKEWIPGWYRDNKVVLFASMPCYTKENVDAQRGNGVYEKSLQSLKILNRLGYGYDLELNLVYNPGGAFLPGAQKELEQDYKKELRERAGIVFNQLLTITNAPIGRFKTMLKINNASDKYIELLSDSFNPDTVQNIMCRKLISVDWQGFLYDCDFNLALGLPIMDKSGRALNISMIKEAIQSGREIIMAEHCYSCTAGAGSSCTGSLA